MATKTIQSTTLISRNEGIVSSKLQEETVMLDIEQGKYFGLDPVGARIWEIIETPSTIDEIVQTLLSEYKVDKNICQQDVQDFVTKMQELKTVVAVE